jgi:hypothetical protein
MTRTVVTAKVGPDGVLHLTLPFAAADANREVKITVEPVIGPVLTPEEWRRAVLATAGKWQGDFERPPQGEPEEREPLS